MVSEQEASLEQVALLPRKELGFFDLSLEIRRSIYGQLIRSIATGGCRISSWNSSDHGFHLSGAKASYNGMLRTCREAYEELLPSLYHGTRLWLNLTDEPAWWQVEVGIRFPDSIRLDLIPAMTIFLSPRPRAAEDLLRMFEHLNKCVSMKALQIVFHEGQEWLQADMSSQLNALVAEWHRLSVGCKVALDGVEDLETSEVFSPLVCEHEATHLLAALANDLAVAERVRCEALGILEIAREDAVML